LQVSFRLCLADTACHNMSESLMAVWFTKLDVL
jgi:hypothetical protein